MKYINFNTDGSAISIVSSETFNLIDNPGYMELPQEYYHLDLSSIYRVNNVIQSRPTRPSPMHVWDVNDLAWKVSISLRKLEKSAAISASCKNEIIGGFISNALGADYLYPNNAEDQTNLSGTVLMSTLPTQPPGAVYLFKCKSADGIWDFRPHTAAQVQQVGAASYAFILAARVKNATLQAQIIAATTSAQVEAVQW